jgi:hypothetical protein
MHRASHVASCWRFVCTKNHRRGDPFLPSGVAIGDWCGGHDRCVVSIKEKNVESWLTPVGRSVKELQTILDDVERPYYEHEVQAA